MGNSGGVRRLGYLCDTFNLTVKLPKIEARNYLYLDPAMPKKGGKSAKWRLVVNVEGLDSLE